MRATHFPPSNLAFLKLKSDIENLEKENAEKEKAIEKLNEELKTFKYNEKNCEESSDEERYSEVIYKDE